jgi:hypothetical protein
MSVTQNNAALQRPGFGHRKLPENVQNPTSRGHALLAGCALDCGNNVRIN